MYPICFRILVIIFCLIATCYKSDGFSYANFTTCEQFERGAKFDPKTVIDSPWRIFYIWSTTTEIQPVHFSLIHKNSLKRFKADLESVHPGWDVTWHLARFFFFPRPGVQVLYLDAYTPGAYRAVVRVDRVSDARPHPGPLFKMADIRMKQAGRLIFMMCCEDLTGFALAREKEVPKTREECEDRAAGMGYRGHAGRCYLELLKNITERTTEMLVNNVSAGMEGPTKDAKDLRTESQARLPVGPPPPPAIRRHRRHPRYKRHRRVARTQLLLQQRLKQARATLHSGRLWSKLAKLVI